MKEKLKNKKVVYTIIGIISVLLVAAAVTYAYWLVTRTQQGENVISSGCLDISLSGKNDITLQDQFPISDEDGMKLTPYEFTVTNNCDTSVDYQIALEAIESGDEISSSALKVALNDDVKLFSSYNEVDATVTNAYEARRLGMGTLANKNSEETYSLRIWIDQEADISEMNKTFKSKITVTVGQGISNDRDTLANKMLASYGGKGAIQEFSEEQTILTRTEDITFDEDYEIWFGTEYAFDEDHGEWYWSGETVQATIKECREGTKNCGNYTFLNEKEDPGTTLYEVLEYYGEGEGFKANVTKYDYPPFVPGVYKAQDDLGDSYYFKGNITNNYVKFGTYAEDSMIEKSRYYNEEKGDIYYYDSYDDCVAEYGSDCEKEKVAKNGSDMYWRIVRVNGDGTIRLIYDGVYADKEYNPSPIAFTNYSRSSSFTGGEYLQDYVHTDEGQPGSNIKNVIDAWYDKHIESTYGKFIADGMFCNYSNGLRCPNKNKIYTVNDTLLGNGLLSNPVGLITAGEVGLASNYYNSYDEAAGNYNHYLRSGYRYWTMTQMDSDIVRVDSIGSYDKDDLGYEHGVRPVINIKADVLFSGAGTLENPYVIAE